MGNRETRRNSAIFTVLSIDVKCMLACTFTKIVPIEKIGCGATDIRKLNTCKMLWNAVLLRGVKSAMIESQACIVSERCYCSDNLSSGYCVSNTLATVIVVPCADWSLSPHRTRWNGENESTLQLVVSGHRVRGWSQSSRPNLTMTSSTMTSKFVEPRKFLSGKWIEKIPLLPSEEENSEQNSPTHDMLLLWRLSGSPGYDHTTSWSRI